MSLSYIKCSKFTKINEIRIKRTIDGKDNLYFGCTEFGLKKVEIIS